MLKKLGKYELIEIIGHGAMGEVYKAHDPLINRLVALKTITGTMVGNAELLDRFYQEARSAGALQHPNIVTVYELGQEGNTPFIAMEFLEGESLEKIIDRRPNLPLSQKVGIIVQVCHALECAHKHGVVHRDIKPGNVMLTKDGAVKVVDFGIARLGDTLKTQTNILIGTLGYMSPQQFHGERADQRSDIWGLGVLFFELLCYKRPFDGENASSLILNIVDENKRSPRILDRMPDCPAELDALIDKMLKKDAAQRFQSMEEVLFEIEPAWRNLQEESVLGLVADSEGLIEAKDLPRARDLLRKALQIDRKNERANQLMETVSATLKRQQIQLQVQGALERGRSFLQDGRFEEAKAEAESALKLDSSYADANEFLLEVKLTSERAKKLQECLQVARQRLAEGALDGAASAIQEALGLDAACAPAKALEKQVRDQQSRRMERKKHADVVQRARRAWGEQKLDECIELLSEGLEQFPEDPEIVKLLETAKADKAEEFRMRRLTEAKSLISTQDFEGAIAIVDSLFTEYPNDPAVRKLRDLLFHDKEETLRQQRLQDHVVALHSLLNSANFSEAVARGEALLREFPHEGELTDLVSFARTELSRTEQKKSLEQALEAVRNLLESGSYEAAVVAAEAAQSCFPHNGELESLLSQARERLKHEESRAQLQKRISDIRRKINGGHLTDAVVMARESIATNGPDAQLTQMLNAAEMELSQRKERKEEQERQVTEAERLLSEGQFRAATQILLEGIETRLLSKKDPRVKKLFTKIQEKEPDALLPPAPAPAKSDSAPVPESSAAKDYAFLPRASSPPTPQPPAIIPMASAAAVGAASGAAAAPAPAREAPPAAPVPSPAWAYREAAPSLPKEEPRAEREPLILPLAEAQREGSVRSTSILPQVLSSRVLMLGGIAIVLVVTITLVTSLVFQRSAKEMEMLNQAQQLEQQKKWPDALAAYGKLALEKDALGQEGGRQAARLKLLMDRETALLSSARSAEAHGDWLAARQLYQQIADLQGDLQPLALAAVQRLAVPASAKPATTRSASRSLRASVGHLPAAESKPPSLAATGKCELNKSDIPRNLRRADSNRAAGNYTDALREYNEVLACDSENAAALTGVEKTKRAMVVPGVPPE